MVCPEGKLPDTPYDAVRMTSEPGVGEISVEWNLDGFHSAVDVFHDAGQKLGTEHRLTGQQKRMLGIGIFSQQADAVVHTGRGKHGDRSVLAAERSIEPVKGPSTLEVFPARYIDCCNGACRNGRHNEYRFEVMFDRMGDRK